MDRDKLLRWQKDLAGSAADAPAVYAIFLVSETDRSAHDIFRAFRTSFEKRKAGFAHLVIFGQHGASTTVRALQSELGLAADSPPTLVMFTPGPGDDREIVPLPAGANGSTETGGWQSALKRAETAMDVSSGDGVICEKLRHLCQAVVEFLKG